ncbi:MAG TPA: hypothetical protein VKZ18_08190 [Polyangia bacterium]|nr:hypothetical protein [Polyangia bacterium]
MIRIRPSLLLPLLAVAACQTQRKPLTGFATQPPGILLDNTRGTTLVIWPLFDLPASPEQTFLPRLNGQNLVEVTSDEGFYAYTMLDLEGWTGGGSDWVLGVPPGTYTVELDDDSGQSWGQSAPLPIPVQPSPPSATEQSPAAIFAHFDNQVGSWTIDPTTQDSDPATDEITVTNLLSEDVNVQRCLLTTAGPTSCASIGTVAAGADFSTVETLVSATSANPYTLLVQLASDPTQSYERDLLQGSASINFGESCQIERIIVHGTRQLPQGPLGGQVGFAMSSCYGYQSGPAPNP